MDIGYIPLSRKFFEHELWQEPRVFSRAEAFADLLRRTRFEANTSTILVGVQSVEIRRGEVAISLRFLSQQWQWSKNKVDKFLKYLEKQGMIEKRTAKGTAQTVIKLCNFDKYNPILQKSGQKKGHERDSKGTILNKDNTGNNNPLISPLQGGNDRPSVSRNSDMNLERKEKVARKRKELDLSFVEPTFQPIMADWLAYKSERGQTYRQKGVEGCYSHLKTLSGNNLDVARRIVEQSIANNYSGLFPLKTTNNVRSARNQPPSPDELAKAVASGIARANTRQEWE
ncbi:MAG: hypothetical protein NC209_04130 [Alistipes sp.]|nr:hypothetical protein [Lachnospiraceae bacterium]MCM1250318.1 hypothetical protein [Alistipes sp.]